MYLCNECGATKPEDCTCEKRERLMVRFKTKSEIQLPDNKVSTLGAVLAAVAPALEGFDAEWFAEHRWVEHNKYRPVLVLSWTSEVDIADEDEDERVPLDEVDE